MDEKVTTNDEFELLKKVPKGELTVLVEGYLGYLSKYKYFRFITIGFVAVILGYNIFVAGKRFPLDELNTIKTIMVSVLSVFVVALLILGVVFFKTVRNLKKQVAACAEKNRLDKKQFQKQFHLFAKGTMGGPGLK
ncbi:hypothetical protein [Maribacter sp. 2-571]|uniref:hypothetical protein n=1 Tax=Maribacter sp. 2-571 TaxID=3417569 RepID=UPI003D331316